MKITESGEFDKSARLAHKAVEARNLADPLAAKGYRKPFERIERERRTRRLTAVAALASFAGLFGFLVATTPAVPPEPEIQRLDPVNQIIAEIPVPGANPGDPVTIIRILAPDEQDAPDVTTRSS